MTQLDLLDAPTASLEALRHESRPIKDVLHDVFGWEAVVAVQEARGDRPWRKVYPRNDEHALSRTHLVRRLANAVEATSEDGCWEWTLSRHDFGYGSLTLGTGHEHAHRLAYELSEKGPVPEGMYVLHHCDNPPCINPSHLYAGTHQDNMADMVARGRHLENRNEPRGDEHPSSKLTAGAVLEIYRLYDDGASQDELGALYGITAGQVGRVLRGEAWAHVYQAEGRQHVIVPGNGKLTEHHVVAIRKAYADGRTQQSLADEYGITQGNVSMIVHRRTWPHVA